MATINFRSKEISLLEAKLCFNGLKSGILKLDLTKKEKIDYLNWEKTKKEINTQAGGEGIFKYLTEKEYLIGELKSRIQIAEFAEKIKYCEKNGHTPKSEHVSSGQSGTKVYGECKRCSGSYERKLTSKEWNAFDKSMNTPMMI